MAKSGVNTKRYSLVFATAVAFCTVCAAGVSTFAWFQANASATVTTTSTSTTITVSKPEEYEFFAYKGNGDDGYDNANPEKFTGDGGDFVSILSGDARASVSGLGPGQFALFCIKLQNKTNPKLKIKSLISNNTTKEGATVKKKIAGSDPDVLINIGWTIDIFTAYSTDGTGYTTFISSPGTDRFRFSQGNETLYSSCTLSSGTNANQVISLPDGHEHEIFAETGTFANIYIFYMVKFSEDAKYQELQTDSDSGQAVDHIPATYKETNERYFKTATAAQIDAGTGNSNCFGGLTFALTKLLVS